MKNAFIYTGLFAALALTTACGPGFEAKNKNSGVDTPQTAPQPVVGPTSAINGALEVSGLMQTASSPNAQVHFMHDQFAISASIPRPDVNGKVTTGTAQSAAVDYEISLACETGSCNYIAALIIARDRNGGGQKQSAALFDQYSSNFNGNSMIPSVVQDNINSVNVVEILQTMKVSYEQQF